MSEKKSLHWADITAEKIVREKGDLPSYTCASGITPSGTVHIGNFREIISVELVVRALRQLGKNVRFIYSWDDYDVFRKVPKNMPKAEVLEQHLRFPITLVPDPFDRDESYARHHEVDVENILPRVGIFPEYLYQAERYRKSLYAEGMRTALQNKEKIREILDSVRDENHKIVGEYWPISAFCAKCNRDTTEILGYDGDYGVEYRCTECGHQTKVDLRECSEIKLGWRVDWPMRWAYEKNVFEPAGKDHHSQGGSFDTARRVCEEVYDWKSPVTFQYDFIGQKGLPGKMASSSGYVLTLGDVLAVYQSEVTRYLFAGTRPNTEFVISFDLDVIKIYEDYDKTERIAFGVDKAKNDDVLAKERRIYQLSQVDEAEAAALEFVPEKMPYQIPFRHLCNLLQINSGDVDAVVRTQSEIKDWQIPRFKERCLCAWNWIREFAPEEFRFSLLDCKKFDFAENEKNALTELRDSVLPKLDETDEKAISSMLYDIAEKNALEPKAFFLCVYRALIGKDQGPRLANFLKIIGSERLLKILDLSL